MSGLAFPKPRPHLFDKIDRRREQERRASAFRTQVWKDSGGRCARCGRVCRRTLEEVPNQGHVDHDRGRNVAPEDKYNPKKAKLKCRVCHLLKHGQRL